MDNRSLGAEFLGTFVLVLGGCGAAMFAGPTAGIVAVSLAFGLTVLCMAYAVGHISGGHFNPAVTLGLIAAGRFDAGKALPYIVAQVVGAVAAAAVLSLILSGTPVGAGVTKWNDMAAVSNAYGGKFFGVGAAFIAEFVLTAIFMVVICGSTAKRAPAGFAPIAIGLALTLIHLVSIPLTNTSVNPARSIGPALFAGGNAVAQLWLFIVAPIAGAIVGGIVSRWLQNE
jgi:aquaporin Z